MRILTASSSPPSIAITGPRIACGGEPGPDGARGGQIFARTLTLLMEEIDMTIASTDFAWVEASEAVPVLRGGSMRELSWDRFEL